MHIEYFGSKIALRDDDSGISEGFRRGWGHERKAHDVLSSLVKDGSTIIDIGANIGSYALLESRTNPNGMVYAVEPVKENIEVLRQSIALNGYTNIQIYEMAIGDTNKIGLMQKAIYSNSGTLLDMEEASDFYKEWFGNIHTEDVPVEIKTLDSFVEELGIQQVDMLRMDVEGFEVSIFKGAQKTLKNMPLKSVIAIEIHPVVFSSPRIVMREMVENLQSFGFTLSLALDKQENSIPFDENNVIESGFLYGDAHCPQLFLTKSSWGEI